MRGDENRKLHDNPAGIDIRGLRNGSVQNCLIVEADDNGIWLNTGTKNTIVANCTILRSKRHDIYMYQAEGCVIRGNIVLDNGQGGEGFNRITLEAPWAGRFNIFEGNRCSGATQDYGIFLFGKAEDYNFIVNNICGGNRKGGVKFEGKHTIVANNLGWAPSCADCLSLTFAEVEPPPIAGRGLLRAFRGLSRF